MKNIVQQTNCMQSVDNNENTNSSCELCVLSKFVCNTFHATTKHFTHKAILHRMQLTVCGVKVAIVKH